ncbi:hypothetical protein NX801_30015 [Streptomyces sp. LP05-1]|uniref:Uncharacterized protein n=1 Tax=Streptomyces pyxinae TaxID=2970734 RepID=A0ABT2CQS8_9ACTN|nr:hypothetical protein [Streptomyces sp. LP05-1]MCS0639800.1 hypothetical protein [Streptomyces sp. LP05-1]
MVSTGEMGHADNQDQEHGAEPSRLPLSEARAREMTAGLREAVDDVRRSVAVLAARVRRRARRPRQGAPRTPELGTVPPGGVRHQPRAGVPAPECRALVVIHGGVAAGPELWSTPACVETGELS